MARTNLSPPAGDVIDVFENACREMGLRVHRGGSSDDGSVQWHLTIPGQKGTMEANWWPTNHALWVDIKPNREADWMPPVVEALKAKF